MDKKLKKVLDSGLFDSKFRKCISSIEDDNLLLKWMGKYVCEIQTFSLSFNNNLTIQLYSDYGLGPRIFIKEKDLESFLKGEPLKDGSYLCGKGIKNFLINLLVL